MTVSRQNQIPDPDKRCPVRWDTGDEINPEKLGKLDSNFLFAIFQKTIRGTLIHGQTSTKYANLGFFRHPCPTLTDMKYQSKNSRHVCYVSLIRMRLLCLISQSIIQWQWLYKEFFFCCLTYEIQQNKEFYPYFKILL